MNPEAQDRFSRRHSYTRGDTEITIREDAPESVRATLLYATNDSGLDATIVHDLMCRVLRRLPRADGWTLSVKDEIEQVLRQAAWWEVYDTAEAIARYLRDWYAPSADAFEETLNAHFWERGIGWQIVDGRIEARGTEAFEATVRGATTGLAEAGQPTAALEIHEALKDLSRRPTPDLTGALHHGMAALECVARETCGESNLTLGQIVQKYPEVFPKPLDAAVEKAWGYASHRGRHLQEGQALERADVEFVVGLAATVATYLASKR